MNQKQTASMRAAADAMQKSIDHLRRPMTHNPTPKRNREYKSRLHDADNATRTQKAMRGLADLHDAGKCPGCLLGISRKTEIAPLVYKGTKNGGYYDCIPDQNYRDTTEAGRTLQDLIGNHDSWFESRRIELMEADNRGLPSFFPTPPDIAEKMAAAADLTSGDRVLEPSAGSGRLIRAIMLQGIFTSDVVAVELNYGMAKTLMESFPGVAVKTGDFLDYNGELGQFDKIVMNPPFDSGADVKHIQHALAKLKPGGRLVALCANGQRQRDALMPLIDENGSWEDLPDDTFKPSGTSTRAAMIVLNRIAGE